MTLAKGFSQRDFSIGQYDRECQSIQTDVTDRGLVFCRNLISSMRGEIKTRSGTKFVSSLGRKTVIIPFRKSDSDILFLAQEGKVIPAVFDENGKLQVGNISVYTPADYIFPALTSNTDQGFVIASTPSSSNAYKGLRYGRSNPTTYNPANTYGTFSLGSTAHNFYLNIAFPSAFCINQMQLGICTNADYPSIDWAKNWISSGYLQWSDDNTNWATVPTSIELKGVIPVTFPPTKVGSPSFSAVMKGVELITTTTEKHKYWRIRLTINNTTSVNLVWASRIVQGVESQLEEFDVTLPESKLKKIKYAQSDNELHFTQEGETIKKITVNGLVIELTTPTYDFDTQYGKPSAVTYFQNRLCFAGFPNYPSSLVTSKFGDFTYFAEDTGEDLTAASPIYAKSAEIKHQITDLFSGRDVLYAQSADGISQSDAGNSAIAPNNINFRLRALGNLSGITPTVKDNVLFFVNGDKKRIFVCEFDLLADRINLANVSLFSREVFKSPISEIHFVDTKEGLVYGMMEDGDMFALLYRGPGQPAGFFPIDTTGSVYDLAPIKVGGEYRLAAIVERDDDYYLELFSPSAEFERTDAFEITNEEKNARTKDNLIKTQFFDCIMKYKNERNEIWSLSGTVLTGTAPVLNLEPYGNKVIRFFDVDNNSADLKILSSAGTNSYNVEIIEDTSTGAFLKMQLPIDHFVNSIDSRAWELSSDMITDEGGYFQDGTTNIIANADGSDAIELDILISAKQGTSTMAVSVTTKSWIGKLPSEDPAITTTSNIEQNDNGTYSIPILRSTGILLMNGSFDPVAGTITFGISSGMIFYDVFDTEYSIDEPVDMQISGKVSLLTAPIQVIDSGRYIGDKTPSSSGVITFNEPVYDLIYGRPYTKIGVIQDNENYLRLKKWGSIAINVMDTMSLQIGAKIGKMENIMKWKGTDFYDSSPIMKNAVLRSNIVDEPEFDKQLIFMTEEGLPFCVRAIEASGEITDRNAN